MFDDLPISGANRRSTHTRWTVLVSTAGQLSILALLLVMQEAQIQALPIGWHIMSLLPTAPGAPTRVVPPVTPSPPPREATKAISFVPPRARMLTQPLPAPTGPAPTMTEIHGAIPGLGGSGQWNSIFSAKKTGPPPPPTLVVGGEVQAARLIHYVQPDYPLKARKANVQGAVVLQARIATNGTVVALHYISGPLALVSAVETAVQQWLYQPTLLNGQPMEVETTITVIFRLKPAKRPKRAKH